MVTNFLLARVFFSFFFSCPTQSRESPPLFTHVKKWWWCAHIGTYHQRQLFVFFITVRSSTVILRPWWDELILHIGKQNYSSSHDTRVTVVSSRFLVLFLFGVVVVWSSSSSSSCCCCWQWTRTYTAEEIYPLITGGSRTMRKRNVTQRHPSIQQSIYPWSCLSFLNPFFGVKR